MDQKGSHLGQYLYYYGVKFLIALSLCIGFFLSSSRELKAQSTINVSGYVYENRNNTDSVYPVGRINVIRLSDFKGTSTRSNGFFSINMLIGDTLVFTSIAHKMDTFICAADEKREELILNVMLQQEFHSLVGIDVYGKDFEGFKHDFIHLEVKDTVFFKMKPQWKFTEPGTNFGITINGPLTALWSVLSKKGKEQRKLAMLIAEEKEKAYFDSVYKRPVVLHFLEMDEQEIEKLVGFCKFTKHFIANNTDYELLLALEKCYQEYKRMH